MVIDIGFLVFLLYGFYYGYSRGFLKTLYAILSIVVAFLLSMKLSPIFIDLVDNVLKLGPKISLLVGFALSFILIVFLVRLLGKRVEKLFKAAKINFINKIMGGVAMASLFVIGYSTIVYSIDRINILAEKQKEKSFTFELMEPIPTAAASAFNQIKPAFKGLWNKATEAMDDTDTNSSPFPPTNEKPIQEK